MARPCRVCTHESRAAIEQAILNGKAAAAICRDFGFTYTVRSGEQEGQEKPDHKIITRHRDEHMGKAYQTAIADREKASGDAMVARLKHLDDELDAVLERAKEGRILEVEGVPLLDDEGKPERVRDERLILAVVREARANMDVGLKLSGRTEHDPMELDRLRAGLENPAIRKLMADLETKLAELDPANQPD